MDLTDEELARWARVGASMSVGLDPLEAAEREGLTEAAFAALDERVETALSASMEEAGDGVSPFVVRYERALREAQIAAQGATTLTLAEFARAVSILSSGVEDPKAALRKVGLELPEVVRAISKYAPQLAKNPASAGVFTRLSQPAKQRKPP